MKSMSLKNFSLAVLIVSAAGAVTQTAHAQRASTVSPSQTTAPQTTSPRTTNVRPAPQTFKARYDGGVFGYNRKIEGTLSFDDAENRLVFRDKKGNQVLFVVPYETITAAFGDVQSRRPKAATVVGSIPVPYGLNIPALFIRNKYRYLTLQYRDSETERVGTTSFKLGNKQLLESVLNTLAAEAELTKRGEIFIRPKNGETESNGVYEVATPPKEN